MRPRNRWLSNRGAAGRPTSREPPRCSSIRSLGPATNVAEIPSSVLQFGAAAHDGPVRPCSLRWSSSSRNVRRVDLAVNDFVLTATNLPSGHATPPALRLLLCGAVVGSSAQFRVTAYRSLIPSGNVQVRSDGGCDCGGILGYARQCCRARWVSHRSPTYHRPGKDPAQPLCRGRPEDSSRAVSSQEKSPVKPVHQTTAASLLSVAVVGGFSATGRSLSSCSEVRGVECRVGAGDLLVQHCADGWRTPHRQRRSAPCCRRT